jgi:hypothetical protein
VPPAVHEEYAFSWLAHAVVIELVSTLLSEPHFALLPAHSINALYFEPQVGSFKSWLHWSTSDCVSGVSAEQTVEPTAGQLPAAAELAAFDELLHAAAPANKTAPTNIIRFFFR